MKFFSSDLPNTKDTAKNYTKSNEALMSRMLLNDNKAGMTGFDKERINQIIFEASKGTCILNDACSILELLSVLTF